MLNKFRRKLRFWLEERRFNKETQLQDLEIKQQHDKMNVLFVTFDSCRYDSFVKAKTPKLDKYGKTYSAYTPATYTLPAHASFFTGIFPMVHEAVPYLNRFTKQLITMRKAGQALDSAKSSKTISLNASDKDMIHGLRQEGYYTIGAGSATWFAKEVLTKHFHDFKFHPALSAMEQCNYLLTKLAKQAVNKPFFAFMNLSETHSPYMHYGNDRHDYSMQARDFMKFPPQVDLELQNSFGKKLQEAQIKSTEYLDTLMGDFLPKLPQNTFVIITADHGEAFGEDGFWGHGVYHPTVMNVPMLCFMLSGEEL